MDDINVRIAECIKSLKIKKTEFASRINVSQAFVSQLTNGISRPSDRTIADICREFNVNEIWLRTGDGEMFQPTTQAERIASLAGNALQDEPQSFRRQLLDDLSSLTPDDWAALAVIARHIAESREKKQREMEDQSLQN